MFERLEALLNDGKSKACFCRPDIGNTISFQVTRRAILVQMSSSLAASSLYLIQSQSAHPDAEAHVSTTSYGAVGKSYEEGPFKEYAPAGGLSQIWEGYGHEMDTSD